MNGIRQSTRSLINCVCLFVLSNVIAVFAAQSVAAQTQPTSGRPPSDVKVVNTPAEPVPVTGTINVGNLGSSPLPVQVVNAPAQPATVTGTVNVANDANGPLIVRDAARIPFQFSVNLDITHNQVTSFSNTIPIPPGKQLVLEYVSGFATLPSGQQIKRLFITTDPGSFRHYFPFYPQAAGEAFIASEPVRMYVIGGFYFGVERNWFAGLANVHVSISGYFVDDPNSSN
jgi:hypothetical protein